MDSTLACILLLFCLSAAGGSTRENNAEGSAHEINVEGSKPDVKAGGNTPKVNIEDSIPEVSVEKNKNEVHGERSRPEKTEGKKSFDLTYVFKLFFVSSHKLSNLACSNAELILKL